MTYAEKYRGKRPVGVLALTNCMGMTIWEVDRESKWAVVSWDNGGKYTGFYRHKLTYDHKKESKYFYKAGRRWYLHQFLTV